MMEQQTSAQSSQIERGDTLLKQGDVREAAEVFAGVVRAEPNNPAGHLGLAEASLALGDFATMQQACAQVQQLAPQGAEAALARALLAVLNQRFDIALQEVEHSIELDPTRGYAHALRAYVLRQLGQRYDGALAEARTHLGHARPGSPVCPGAQTRRDTANRRRWHGVRAEDSDHAGPAHVGPAVSA
jgi:Tfp pilus assembly protein PilF